MAEVRVFKSNDFGAKYDGKQVQGHLTFASQDSLFTDVFAPEIIAGDANKALRGGELVVGEDIADDQGWKVGDTVKVSTENTTVDEEATAQHRPTIRHRFRLKFNR